MKERCTCIIKIQLHEKRKKIKFNMRSSMVQKKISFKIRYKIRKLFNPISF